MRLRRYHSDVSDLVGTAYHPLFLDLKQSLLLFDRLAIPSMATWLSASAPAIWQGSPESWRQHVTELEWLMEKGLLVDPYPTDDSDWLNRLFDATEHSLEPDGVPFWSHGAIARSVAAMLREERQWNALPLIPDDDWSVPTDRAARRADVVHIVLKELQMPRSNHGFEDILAFRDQARSQGLVQSLRVWMNAMAAGTLSPVEVGDVLEDLSSRYERALRLEKMAASTSIVETAVVTTAEVAESLVKFQWSRLARRLFDVRHQRIDLMKAEASLPGREVAYIVQARETFGTGA